jgi:tetratricopeptide (TPR) repeat protein
MMRLLPLLSVLLAAPASAACQSISGCEAAIQRAPADPVVRRDYGLVLLRNGANEEAVESYRTAITLAPEDARGYEALGGALAVLRDYTGALPLLERAVALDQGRAESALRILQFVQEGLLQREAALSTARRLADRGDVLAMFDLAVALEATEPTEARRWLERAAAAGHAGALDRLAEVRRVAGEAREER